MGDIGQDLSDAIADVLGAHEHSMTVRFVALVEVLDGDGGRALWRFSTGDAAPWDIKGMLLHGLDEERRDGRTLT